MTEIERKALALLRECAEVPAYVNLQAIPGFVRAALFRAIEQHEALEAENERLREALDAVWKEATTMRNASKLVGPYPTNPADNRIWARSMYHAGKRIMEMLKPARAALEARHD